MKSYALPTLTCCLAVGLGVGAAASQAARSVDAHVAAARAAAGQEHTFLFDSLCGTAAAAPAAPGTPERATWHAEPLKVFDNLYYVGEIEYSSWAITTSEGIIVLDAIFDYSVEDEVVGGLKKLGLDPSRIRYVIVSHGHRDHVGGASYLQSRFGARVLMSDADWGLVERTGGAWPKPKRDIVVTDGQRLTLGDTTVTLYLTPGHTLGTVSTLIPVRDGGTPHTAAAWGGTAFNWLRNRDAYITAQRPDRFWFDSYVGSARRFRDIVTQAGADVLISNHTNFDNSKKKLPMLAARKSGDPHPYVIGAQGVQRYLTVAEECARAGLGRIAKGA
jgi:metallo-beta-lactamase class B